VLPVAVDPNEVTTSDTVVVAVFIGVVVLLLVVGIVLRRLRLRRLGLRPPGQWEKGPYAEPAPTPAAVQRNGEGAR
jgi:hypothetical protein